MSAARNASIDKATSLIYSQATRNQDLKGRSLGTKIDCIKKTKSLECSKKYQFGCYTGGQPRPPLVEIEQQSASYV
jgi:hypothetical protein